jgi:hypothetical protein
VENRDKHRASSLAVTSSDGEIRIHPMIFVPIQSAAPSVSAFGEKTIATYL